MLELITSSSQHWPGSFADGTTFFFVSHSKRELWYLNVTSSPTWEVQKVRQATCGIQKVRQAAIEVAE